MSFQPATQDDLLALWRRLFPPSYTAGIETEDDGVSFVVFQAMAALFARVAQAQCTSTQAYYLLPSSLAVAPWAQGAEYAVGTVQIRRATPAWADLTIPAGTALVAKLQTSDGEWIDGPDFQLLQDLAVPAGDVGPWTAQIRATRVGYQGNLPPERITAFVLLGTATVSGTATAPDTLVDDGNPDRFTLDMLGRYLRIVSGPDASPVPRRIVSVAQGPFGVAVQVDGVPLLGGAFTAEIEEWQDLGLTVTQPDPTTGGRHGWLDAIGYDRGLFRQLGEDDEAFRARIATLDDVVCPGAVVRLCERLLTPAGIPWRLIEAGDPVVLTAYRWDPSLPDMGAGPLVTINFAERTRMFAIAVGLNGAGEDGTQLDVEFGATDTNDVDGDATCDGAPQQWLATLHALRAQLDRIRAGGVAALILLDPAYFPL